MNHASIKSQQGFTLIETSIAMIIFMMWFTSITQFGLAVLKKDAGERAGTKIAQYNAAVAAYINASQPNVPMRGWGGPLPNVSNIGWLQDAATCPGGQANQAFLPCGFDAWLPYGLVMGFTNIGQNGQAIQAVTTFGVPHEGMNGFNPIPDRVAGGHIINGAEAFKGIYASTVEHDNANNTVNKPLCPIGKTAQIFMVPGQWNLGGFSEPVGSVDLKYVDHLYYWMVYFYVTSPSHPTGFVPPAGEATALVTTTCQ